MNQLSLLIPTQRSAVLHTIEILCQVFWGPSSSLSEKLFKQEFRKEIKPLTLFIAIDPPNTLEEINTLVGSFKNSEDLFSVLETAYVSAFINNRKGHIVPLYQSCYEYDNAPMMGPSAIAMKERLAESGLSIESQINEPPDHLCIEMEYLYFFLPQSPISAI